MYPRKQLRRDKYDYSTTGVYFVTIICKYRTCYFGKIENKQVLLSPQGIICQQHIQDLPTKRPTITFYEHIIMPNHVHLLFYMQEDISKYPNQTLSSVISNFKAGITKENNVQGLDFTRHRSFHDHIVRNEKAFQNIAHYIKTNPERWQQDTFYS